MTGTDSYSTTPATNATADGGAINWAEGQPPSSVNNTARQWMADERASFNDLIWFQYGTGDQGAGNLAVPAVYASGTSFTIAGTNVTAVYHAGRRLRAVGSGTGTIYGTISSSSFSTNTTVNAVWDSGSLSNETLVISLSQIPVTGAPVPGAGIASPAVSTWTPTDASGASLTFGTVSANYTRYGNVVVASATLIYPSTADTSSAKIGGLPVTAGSGPGPIFIILNNGGSIPTAGFVTASNTTFVIVNSTSAAAVTNANLSGIRLNFTVTYLV